MLHADPPRANASPLTGPLGERAVCDDAGEKNHECRTAAWRIPRESIASFSQECDGITDYTAVPQQALVHIQERNSPY